MDVNLNEHEFLCVCVCSIHHDYVCVVCAYDMCWCMHTCVYACVCVDVNHIHEKGLSSRTYTKTCNNKGKMVQFKRERQTWTTLHKNKPIPRMWRKICSASLVIREMPTKTTVNSTSHHLVCHNLKKELKNAKMAQ